MKEHSFLPGYVGHTDHTAERLRVTVGEISDYAEARTGPPNQPRAVAAAPAAAGLLSSGEAPGPAKQEVKGEEREQERSPRPAAEEAPKEEKDKASSGKRTSEKTHKDKKEKTHRDRRGSGHRRGEGERTAPAKREPSGESAFNAEETALRTTAPKAAIVARPKSVVNSDEQGVEETENELSGKEEDREEEIEDEVDERESKEPISPRSPSYKDRKRSRRTRSRSRRRRRREEESDRQKSEEIEFLIGPTA